MCESITMIKFVLVWQSRFCTKVHCIAAAVSEAPPQHVASSHKPSQERKPSTAQETEDGKHGSDATSVEPQRALRKLLQSFGDKHITFIFCEHGLLPQHAVYCRVCSHAAAICEFFKQDVFIQLQPVCSR